MSRRRLADGPKEEIVGTVNTPDGESVNVTREEVAEYLSQQNFLRRRFVDFFVFLVLLVIALLYLFLEHNINGLDYISDWVVKALDPGPTQYHEGKTANIF